MLMSLERGAAVSMRGKVPEMSPARALAAIPPRPPGRCDQMTARLSGM